MHHLCYAIFLRSHLLSLAHTQEEGNQTPPFEERSIKELWADLKTTIAYIKDVIGPLKFTFLSGAVIAMFLLSNHFVFMLRCCESLCKLCFPLFSAVKKLKIKIWLTSSLCTRPQGMCSMDSSHPWLHLLFPFLLSLSFPSPSFILTKEWITWYRSIHLHTHVCCGIWCICLQAT